MWRLRRTDTFIRTARKLATRRPQLVAPLTAALELLASDPRHPRLRLHRLHGPLEGLWAARVSYQIRLVVAVDDDQREVTLLDIGSHDEVYR
jgi:addiction module RelE/StbE family toxin